MQPTGLVIVLSNSKPAKLKHLLVKTVLAELELPTEDFDFIILYIIFFVDSLQNQKHTTNIIATMQRQKPRLVEKDSTCDAC